MYKNRIIKNAMKLLIKVKSLLLVCYYTLLLQVEIQLLAIISISESSIFLVFLLFVAVQDQSLEFLLLVCLLFIAYFVAIA